MSSLRINQQDPPGLRDLNFVASETVPLAYPIPSETENLALAIYSGTGSWPNLSSGAIRTSSLSLRETRTIVENLLV
jgi:hypothetical protein